MKRRSALIAAVACALTAVVDRGVAGAYRFDWGLIPRPMKPPYDSAVDGLLPTQRDFLEAAERGDLETIRHHLNRFEFLGLRDGNGQTALMKASHQGHLPVVLAMVKTNPAIINDRDKNGDTSLDWAYRGKEEGVKTDAVIERLEFLGGKRGQELTAEAAT
jgi:Ankyrin repeats (3 copies)